jgi:hypothetical protein
VAVGDAADEGDFLEHQGEGIELGGLGEDARTLTRPPGRTMPRARRSWVRRRRRSRR